MTQSETETTLDPVLISVMANRLDGIVREMTNTLLRSARSAVISSARDFSCCLVTGDDKLLASAEGLPVHIFGCHIQTENMHKYHEGDIQRGDAYLDNDPYGGNTHPADHTFMVPVFFEGEHMFTAVSKCHMADIGNSIPSSYFVRAKDVYEEGALVFPGVRIQRDFKNVEDIMRMCRARIRVPDQWYGDYLAGLGSARIAERRLEAFCEKYGKETVKAFMKEWFNYSERRMIDSIRRLPKASLVNKGRSDPLEGVLPEGVELTVKIEIDPDEAEIHVDLSDNPPSVEAGMNTSLGAATSAVVGAVFNALDKDLPRNEGAFRRLHFKYAEDSIVGAPKFPHSCSVATTNIAERLVNITQSAFAQLGDGMGLSEGGAGLGAGMAVISGHDPRRGNQAYVNRLMLSTNGGPASPEADGWVNYAIPVIAGLMYRDSVEVDELKHPIRVESLSLVTDSAGAGRRRGAPAQQIEYGPTDGGMTSIISCDGQHSAPRGVVGGLAGTPGETWLIEDDAQPSRLPNVAQVHLQPGQRIRGRDSAGGGYGDPLDREPERVLLDVLEGWETRDKALNIYGVVFAGEIDDETLAIDLAATEARRSELKQAGAT
ncbi:MAG: hydantoinase B/oxoprolinase family protein [Alphaproteobacteria bacterium]|nr:hydantoinase B/oxoprolinase family protein [Alphaproteobacteria bacterium]